MKKGKKKQREIGVSRDTFRQRQAAWNHKKVIDAYLSGEGTPAECWQSIYPGAGQDAARSKSCELFNTLWAKDYVEQQERALSAARLITRESLVEKYEALIITATSLEVPQVSAAKACLDSIAKMCGLTDPEQIIIKRGEVSDEELDAAIVSRQKALEA